VKNKKPIRIDCEPTPTGFWTYVQRSAGQLPGNSLSQILNWILEQMNLGHFKAEYENGDVVSLAIGKRAAIQATSCAAAAANAQNRLLAVNLAGLMAQAREGGIEPQYDDLSKRVSRDVSKWGERNTEFHYSFELLKILGRLNKKTFKLVAAPIAEVAPETVRSYLRESTRCWMYGFHGASIALSRACLEESLKSALYAATTNTRSELKDLIREARKRGLLDECMVDVARSIQAVGNRFLHGKPITEDQSREALDGVRSIAEQVFSA